MFLAYQLADLYVPTILLFMLIGVGCTAMASPKWVMFLKGSVGVVMYYAMDMYERCENYIHQKLDSISFN